MAVQLKLCGVLVSVIAGFGMPAASAQAWPTQTQPIGACCTPSGACLLKTMSGCASLVGMYAGSNTACTANLCSNRVIELPVIAAEAGQWLPVAISGNGRTIIASSSGAARAAMMWSAGDLWRSSTPLPALAGSPRGVSADGSRIVGQFAPPYDNNGFVWIRGSAELTVIPPVNGWTVRPMNISPNGLYIVGEWSSATGTRAARWNSSGAGFVDLGAPPASQPFASATRCDNAGNWYGLMTMASNPSLTVAARNMSTLGLSAAAIAHRSGLGAVSDNGSVVVGSLTAANGYRHASRVVNSTWTDLHAYGFTESWATDCTGDGTTVVGRAFRSGAQTGGFCSFIWRQSSGMVELREYLATRYANLDITGWTFQHVVGISDDGKRICGVDGGLDGTSVRPWLVMLPDVRP